MSVLASLVAERSNGGDHSNINNTQQGNQAQNPNQVIQSQTTPSGKCGALDENRDQSDDITTGKGETHNHEITTYIYM